MATGSVELTSVVRAVFRKYLIVPFALLGRHKWGCLVQTALPILNSNIHLRPKTCDILPKTDKSVGFFDRGRLLKPNAVH